MSPSFSVKNGVRYPFYVSSALLRGRKAQAGSVARVSAAEIEAVVQLAVRQNTDLDNDAPYTASDLIEKHVVRVVVKTNRVVISLKALSKKAPKPIEIPRTEQKSRVSVRIDGDYAGNVPRTSNPQLVQAIVRAHAWLEPLTNGTYDSIESLARSVDLHPKVIRSRIRLAFLAPNVTREFLSVAQPSLRDLNNLAASI